MDKDLKYQLEVFTDYEKMSENAASFIIETADREIDTKGYFTLVLSGGKTPRRLYSILSEQNTDWHKIMLFWGDERFIPHNHPESNFKMAWDNFISKIKIPDKNIYPIPTDTKLPEESAKLYENTLKVIFDRYQSQNSFDCILLGIGEDGHTASLFPGSPVLEEKKRWVKEVLAPSNYSIRWRITLTLPIINRAKCIMFLVSGETKRPIIKAMLNPNFNEKKYPAQLVNPQGEMLIYTDINLEID